MADTTPPPPKSGGSGPIIIAAVLMLLLIGGLITWKVMSGGGDTKPVASVTTTSSAAPVLDEPPPPPPPPPPEEPSATPGEKPKGKVASGAGPCSAVCSGTASAALQSAVAGRAGQSRSCYEKALSSNSTLEGTLTLNVKVGPGGQVCGARVTSDGLHDPGVSNCVVNRFMASSFPAPQGGCAEVQVPLRFMPKR